MKPTQHCRAPHQRGHERGEGVISMAIAVLIVAFLGVAMWFGFNQIWTDTETQISNNVTEIGS